MAHIDIDKFIASLIHEHRRHWGTEDDDDGIICETDLCVALAEQGLKYDNGKIRPATELEKTERKFALSLQDNKDTQELSGISHKFKNGDIIVSKEGLIFKISDIDSEGYCIKGRPGIVVPFEFENNWELLSVAERRIREKIVSDMCIEQMVLDYAKEASVSPSHYLVGYYRKGIEDTIKAIKGE